MSRDIPIIFSASMVRALLDGRKTMTRRLAHQAPRIAIQVGDGPIEPTMVASSWQKVKAGDRLYVRESGLWFIEKIPGVGDCPWAHYRATDEGDFLPGMKWRPSIHMPRWASRITLVVTAMKIERLQDISEADAWAEGACSFAESGDRSGSWAGLSDANRREMTRTVFGTAANAFHCLFDQLHGPSVWDDNPEVVALTFRVIKANIDAPEAVAA